MFSQMMLMTSIMHRKSEIDCDGNDPDCPLWTNHASWSTSTPSLSESWLHEHPSLRSGHRYIFFFGQEAYFRYYHIIYRIGASAAQWWARHRRPSSLALLLGLIHFRSPRWAICPAKRTLLLASITSEPNLTQQISIRVSAEKLSRSRLLGSAENSVSVFHSPGMHIYCHSMLLSLFTFSRIVPRSQRLFQGSDFVQGRACECSRLETSLWISWPSDQNGIWMQVVLLRWRMRCFSKENKVTRLVTRFREYLPHRICPLEKSMLTFAPVATESRTMLKHKPYWQRKFKRFGVFIHPYVTPPQDFPPA
jgi:hypothetical protein